MELPQITGASAPNTDLGRLQRGRGSGWLRAADSDSGVTLFLECLQSDPRWDHQVEARADYYATLALRLSVSPGALLPVSTEDDHEGFRLQILEAMAQRGSNEASRELALVPQVPDDREAKTVTAELAPAKTEPTHTESDAPIELLLADSQLEYRKAVLHRLRITQNTHEVEALHRASLDSGSPGWRLALRVLGSRGDTTGLPAAESVLIVDATGADRASAFRYVKALPPSVSLPLARDWLSHTDGRGAVAKSVLAVHAELIDIPAIRSALADATDYYAVCSLVEALGRLAAAGPFPELHRVYEESAYSYARARAVDAMAATDPEFAQRWATECLWDCEESTRLRGAQFAPETAMVMTRLHELADDIHEMRDVRDAAVLRVG
jgi:hypothetical protein